MFHYKKKINLGVSPGDGNLRVFRELSILGRYKLIYDVAFYGSGINIGEGNLRVGRISLWSIYNIRKCNHLIKIMRFVDYRGDGNIWRFWGCIFGIHFGIQDFIDKARMRRVEPVEITNIKFSGSGQATQSVLLFIDGKYKFLYDRDRRGILYQLESKSGKYLLIINGRGYFLPGEEATNRAADARRILKRVGEEILIIKE